MNTLKVGLMLTALTALFLWIGSAVGGSGGMIIAAGLALVMNVGSYWFSDKLVIRMTGAKPVSPSEAPALHRMVEELAQRAGIPKPALYIVEDASPNAFATGRNPEHGVVAVNTGLLNILNEEEVRGVVAHEMAHIRHRDTLTMAIVATLAGAIMMIANFARFAAFFGGGHSSDEEGGGGNPLVMLLVALVAPLAAMLVQMGISRAREYEADALGAEIAGTPRGLSNALLKLHRGAEMVPSHTMSPSNAHLCIVNPFAGIGGIANLFSTHPPVEERVRRLRAMEGQSHLRVA